jgi:WD40 repeat protein
LINDSSFFEDFEANQWSLSEGYEANLAVRAEYLVDKFATKIGGSFKEVFGRNDLVPNNPIQFQGVLSGDINKAHVTRFASNFSSSNSSSEGDQVFESIPLPTMEHNIRLEPNARRQYSSSPPTSFSNDTPDGLGRVDSDGRYNSSDPKLGLPQQQPLHERRSSRLLQHTQSQESLSEDTDLVTSAPHPKPEAKVHDRKPGLSAIREANALRVASLDEGLGRPYLCSLDREDIRRTCEMMRESPDRYISKVERELLEESVLHVDFCPEEVEVVCNVIMAAKNIKKFEGTALKPWLLALMVDEQRNTERLCSAIQTMARKPGKELGRHLLRLRDSVDLCAFLQDAAAGCVTIASRLAIMDSKARTFTRFPKPSVCSLLWQREIWGMAPFRVCQGEQPFCIEMWNQIEDSIVRKSEWTDCSGDVSAISWTGSDSFVCGATAHSDYHNMQYNKPGNLLLGSASLDTLKAVDGHRIERPIVGRAENGENSLDSMRQTQDPWLYTSVVSTSHCEVSGYTFTASFDETVKVWKVSADGACIDLCGTWAHDGKVNFVVTSQNHDRVATASDVSNNAIRVYNFDKSNVLNSPYDTYCGDKAHEQAQELRRRDTWAYFPATIQWGKAPSVEKLLLVGYSPRSVTGHESDIPDEKKNSGELCIWNVKDGQRVQISSARTQNVFEVIWHPTQPIFLAATSPCGVFEPEIKTQIRLFGQNEFGTFLHIKTLDCPASDINELTLM